MSSSGCMSGLNFRHAAFEFRHTDDDVWPRPLSTSEFPRLSSFAFFFVCHEVCEFNTLEEDHLPPLFILSYFCPTTNFCPAHPLRLSRTPNSPVVLPAQRPNVFPFQKCSKTAPPPIAQASKHTPLGGNMSRCNISIGGARMVGAGRGKAGKAGFEKGRKRGQNAAPLMA